jgi:hypothetical protein
MLYSNVMLGSGEHIKLAGGRRIQRSHWNNSLSFAWSIAPDIGGGGGGGFKNKSRAPP